jgi:hypothetical protein
MNSSFMLVSSNFITDYSKALVILSFTESPKCESGESNGSPEFPSNGFTAQRAQASEEVMFSCLLLSYNCHCILLSCYTDGKISLTGPSSHKLDYSQLGDYVVRSSLDVW